MKIEVLDSFYAPRLLGKSRRMTPEGYLVCEGVRLARIGFQDYHKSELADVVAAGAVQPGPNGMIQIQRTEAEVFHPDSLASYQNKPLTLDHPSEFVTPRNYVVHAVGEVVNARRGTEDDANWVVGDAVIKAPHAIQFVNDNLPEVSAGYNAEYVSIGPGRGEQRDIRINHVAIISRGRGRAGSRFKDSQEHFPMKDPAAIASMLALFGVKENAAQAATLINSLPEVGAAAPTTDAKALTAEDVTKIVQDCLKTHVPAGTQPTQDSASQPTVDATFVQTLVANAEIIAPGHKVAAVKTQDEAYVAMLDVLEHAKHADVVKKLAPAGFRAVTKDSLATVYSAAAVLSAQANTAPKASPFPQFPGQRTKDSAAANPIASLQKNMQEGWAKRAGGAA